MNEIPQPLQVDIAGIKKELCELLFGGKTGKRTFRRISLTYSWLLLPQIEVALIWHSLFPTIRRRLEDETENSNFAAFSTKLELLEPFPKIFSKFAK